MGKIRRASEILRNKGVKSFINASLRSFVSRIREKNKLIQSRISRSYPYPYKTIAVDPANISYMVIPKFYNDHKNPPHFIGGDWDTNIYNNTNIWSSRYDKDNYPVRELVPIENYVLYQSMKERYINNVPWSETEHHHRCKEHLQMGDDYVWQHCYSMEEVRETYNKIDRLHASIRDRGYLSQEEIRSDGYWSKQPDAVNAEVLVNIGRDGEIIFDEGRHRLLLAKILSINEIPVRVLVRHPQWQKKRKRIAEEATSELPKIGKDVHPDCVEFVTSDT